MSNPSFAESAIFKNIMKALTKYTQFLNSLKHVRRLIIFVNFQKPTVFFLDCNITSETNIY